MTLSKEQAADEGKWGVSTSLGLLERKGRVVSYRETRGWGCSLKCSAREHRCAIL